LPGRRRRLPWPKLASSRWSWNAGRSWIPRPGHGGITHNTPIAGDLEPGLLSLVQDDAGPAAELVRTGRLELAGDNTYDLGHVPTWYRGRIVIIGDAAHAPSPSSGQGASLALEDAVVLAQSLRDHGNVPAAFAAYETARRQRVEKISGNAFSCCDLTWMKWILTPSISVVNCGSAFSFASALRQS
jgi:2-polyprenyl-6-methoxyphenol hydroxylase-like FAD-dependent oxidoreductase